MQIADEVHGESLVRAAAEIALGQALTPFTQLLLDYAARDPRVCYVGVDTMDLEFQKSFPERAFDVGIAEQNEMGVAMGLAKTGMIPVVQAWSPFTPLRNFDQLRNSVARHRGNIKIITTALGLVNCSHGTTHHDLESLALFRVIPNLVVLAPMDGVQFADAFHTAMAYDGPVVIMGPPEIYAPGEDGASLLPVTHRKILEIGKAEWLLDGSDACLFAFGPALRYAWKAADKLKSMDVSTSLVNMYSLKPVDESVVLQAARNHRAIISVEEQLLAGGLGSAIAEILAENAIAIPFRRLGIPDKFVEDVGNWTETREGIGLTTAALCETVVSLLKRRD